MVGGGIYGAWTASDAALRGLQIALIEAGLQEPAVKALNLIPRRDFSDVRDVVAGYVAALEHGEPGEAYNVCSGRSASVEQISNELLSLSTRRNIQLLVSNPELGPGAILNQVGSSRRLEACSSWKPEISISQSLQDLLDSWRGRVSKSANELKVR